MNTEKPKDPIVEKLNKTAQHIKYEKDLADGEQLMIADFRAQALQLAPSELQKIEEQLSERCATINADVNVTELSLLPQLRYDKSSHWLEAGKYAAALQLSEGYDPFRFRLVVGLHPNAHQFMAEIPDVPSMVWTFFAKADEKGFFWLDAETETRWRNEEIVDKALECLSDLLGRDLQ